MRGTYDDTMCAAVVTAGDGAEALLSCCVPLHAYEVAVRKTLVHQGILYYADRKNLRFAA
jgi:hypothetical protein